MKKLTEKQNRFALAYVETGNRAEAYRRAYDSSRMAEKTIQRKAQEVAALAHVTAKVDEIQAEAQERSNCTVDKVIQKLADIAFSNMADFVEWDGNGVKLKDLNRLSPGQLRCIKTLRQDSKGSLQIQLYDKIQALYHLGKHLGMFTGDPSITDKVTFIFKM